MHTQSMIQRAFSPRVFAGGLMGMGTTQAPSREDIEREFWEGYERQTSSRGRAACEYPTWCNWIGGMDRLFDACLPFTPEELRACQAAEFGPAMTPEAREEALRAGDTSVAAYCRMHPEECTAYEEALKDPNADLRMWGWIAAGVGILILVLVIGRGR